MFAAVMCNGNCSYLNNLDELIMINKDSPAS